MIVVNQEETNIKFPCDFPLKVIGKTGKEFEIETLMILRKHFPDIREGALTFNQSKQNSYVAITATIWVEDKKTLDALYKDLSDSPHVIFAL